MAKIGLARIDDRLIHGQVITKWVSASKSDRIVIVDDALVTDSFLKSIFELAKPPSISTIEVKSTVQAAGEWQANEMGQGTILLLFKYVKQVKDALDKGLHVDKLQIAGLAAGPGRKRVYASISLSNEDATILKEISDRGIEVYIQLVPDEKPVSLQSILKSHFKSLNSKEAIV
ncbi:MAG: PTS sugar transporter subunit IIB [Oscillospiraceae bacterium]|nr:PTS sugar transporter subunit IIB [Oscillospiraceae bacterium]